MTPRPVTTAPRPTPRRALSRLVASTTLLGALVLAGCGTSDALVGLHPAPAEQTAAAPLDTEGATAVAARLLAAKEATVEGDEKAAAAARAEVLTGDALRVANAEAARGATTPEATDLAAPAEPTIVAQSQGRQWPRAILASTLDEATEHPVAARHGLRQARPAVPHRLERADVRRRRAARPRRAAGRCAAARRRREERAGRLARRGRRGLRGGHRAAEGQGHRGGRRRRPVRDGAQDRGRGPGQGPRQARNA